MRVCFLDVSGFTVVSSRFVCSGIQLMQQRGGFCCCKGFLTVLIAGSRASKVFLMLFVALHRERHLNSIVGL